MASSRGSLATTSSMGSSSSLSFTDIYLEQPELADPDLRNKLDSLLQEGGQVGYRPSSSITTIHEHEVAPGGGQRLAGGPEENEAAPGGAESSRVQALRLSETPRSMNSLSPRSSLSSLSPPCSPLVSETVFLSGETAGLDLELRSRLAELEMEPQEQRGDQLEEKQNLNEMLGEEVKGESFTSRSMQTRINHTPKSVPSHQKAAKLCLYDGRWEASAFGFTLRCSGKQNTRNPVGQ